MISIKKNSEFFLVRKNTDSVLVARKVVQRQNYIEFLLLMMDLQRRVLSICARNVWKK